jgi:hypothetical protein
VKLLDVQLTPSFHTWNIARNQEKKAVLDKCKFHFLLTLPKVLQEAITA